MEHSLTDHADNIRRVSKEVAREFTLRHGFEVVSADDIEQSVWEQFLKSGMTSEEQDDMESSHAYIPTTARYNGANNEARARRRSLQAYFQEDGDASGERRSIGAVMARTLGITDSTGTGDAGGLWWLLSAAESTVVNILFGIENEAQQRTAWLCYFEGMNSLEMADLTNSTPASVRKSLQRARLTIGPERDACLRAWRLFRFPAARRLRQIDAKPKILMEAVTSG